MPDKPVAPQRLDIDIGIHVNVENQTLIFTITELDYTNLRNVVIHNSGGQANPTEEDMLFFISMSVSNRLSAIEQEKQIQLGNYHSMLLIGNDVGSDIFKIEP